jgi:MOSC domain-containing protein YiiM
MAGRVVQVNVNPDGGVPKLPVPEAFLSFFGVQGDLQRDIMFHGGPYRAVSLFSLELIQALRAEGHPIAPGTTGENLSISGLDWARLAPGDRLRAGEQVWLQLTGFAAPCATIAESFLRWNVTRIAQEVRPGWSRLYAAVLQEGVVRPGDRVEWQLRPLNGWPEESASA